MNPTLRIRITAIVLTAVCWISAFVLFWKKPGEAVLSGFGCTVLITLIAEHINNYLVRRKK
jgi:hypothetical protein